jgi:hypothetical protein
MALASPAGAASQTTTCKVLTAKARAQQDTVKKCTASTTRGSGVLTVDKGVKNTDLITWANAGTTTFKDSWKVLTTSQCPSGEVEEQLNTKVVASTGTASGITGKVSVSICLPSSGKGKVTLLPGTVWKF